MSKRFTLNEQDINKWLKNTAIFLAPAVLLALLAIQQGKGKEEVMAILQLWMLNTAIDITRKFISEK
jgi:hypothetical protein